MIHIGTSGFSYESWENVVYPQDLPSRQRLPFYAQMFDTVEINFSYYNIPSASSLVSMADRTPPDFIFTIKAHQEMTHDRTDNAAVFRRYCTALEPWIERKRLGCVLAQFPNSFRNTPGNRDYLRTFRERMGEIPTVVEFRHRDWIEEEIFALLRELDLGYCCVDEPRLPTLVHRVYAATSDVTYVRFHGRNAGKWWRHDEAWERYDYHYTEEELRPWIPKIEYLADHSKETFVFANNHWRGQAVDTARQLKMLLKK
ncbi:MAG: DUF72 domain-containing protein [Anaerolineales bacterium]